MKLNISEAYRKANDEISQIHSYGRKQYVYNYPDPENGIPRSCVPNSFKSILSARKRAVAESATRHLARQADIKDEDDIYGLILDSERFCDDGLSMRDVLKNVAANVVKLVDC